MKVMNIIHDSIVDGEGLRTVVFLAGCPHMCEGCHNKQSWNINNGFDMSVDEVFEEIMKTRLQTSPIQEGAAFACRRTDRAVRKIKQHSEKDIWLYSGYTYEQILKNEKHSALLAYCDVLVDGPFELKKGLDASLQRKLKPADY